MNPTDMAKIMEHLRRDPVVRAVYDAKSEEIGIGVYRFKAEIGACERMPTFETTPTPLLRVLYRFPGRGGGGAPPGQDGLQTAARPDASCKLDV